MKTKKVTVPWKQGLHLKPAANIVKVARGFHSSIRLRIGRNVADATSILSLAILCATLNTAISIEASGDDEKEAVRAVAACFTPDLDIF